MWRYILAAAITAVIMFAIYGPRSMGRSTAQASTFVWSGALADQGWVNVRNTTGRVRVEPSGDDSVHIRAVTRSGRRSRDVQVLVNRNEGDLYVCAVATRSGRCGPNGYVSGRARGLTRLFRGRTDMHVDFTVSVPEGVFADASTTNGPVSISGVHGEAKARTVNGRIEATDIYGPVTARSTNGTIRVRLDSLPAGAPLSFRTTNGSITAELPQELSADVEIATTNGRINSNYPITVPGEMSSRRINGRIGEGGRELSIRTTNGSITLRPVAGGSRQPDGHGETITIQIPGLPALPGLPEKLTHPNAPSVRVTPNGKGGQTVTIN